MSNLTVIMSGLISSDKRLVALLKDVVVFVSLLV